MNEKNQVKYRHELKYVCTAAQLALLQGRIHHLMPLDSHVGEDGMYHIRSLYFDDMDNRCYYENENGTDPREKFRIRIYNGSAARISLELKKKERGKTLKLSCPLTEEQCRMLMRGEVLPDSQDYPPILQKLLLLMKTRMMRPKIIVEYDRVPYICQMGNVRVTLDQNISSSYQIDTFLNQNIYKRPIMPAGMHILEVKFDEFLPDSIYRTLQLDSLRQTAYSKFYLSRKYNI
ncbi:MAG: polyphosphate polymerase domain-containing protein [Lachnospiraceae bacterium]